MTVPRGPASPGDDAVRADLRTTALGAAAWGGALIGLHLVGAVLWLLVVTLAACSLLVSGRSRMVSACLLTGAVLAGSAAVRVEVTQVSPLSGWAGQRATADIVLVVTSDPVLREGRFGEFGPGWTRRCRGSARCPPTSAPG